MSADDIKPNGCKGPSLCTDLPLEESCGFYFNVGLIYEQMSISDTTVAFIEVTGPNSGTAASPSIDHTLLNLNFGMEPGFRFGVGYEHGHDDWQVNTSFEWLRSYGTLNEEVTDPTFIRPYFDDLDGFPHNADDMLNVDYFLLDVYLSRGSYISEKYSFEPIAGFKATWIYYDNSLRFSDDAHYDAGQSYLFTSVVDFWGIGPMIGLNGNYCLISKVHNRISELGTTHLSFTPNKWLRLFMVCSYKFLYPFS